MIQRDNFSPALSHDHLSAAAAGKALCIYRSIFHRFHHSLGMRSLGCKTGFDTSHRIRLGLTQSHCLTHKHFLGWTSGQYCEERIGVIERDASS
jgi:hypothetical protein